jgi:predicted transcriptional regulator
MVINKEVEIEKIELYEIIKIISNKSIFKLLEITQDSYLSINEIRKKICLSYGRIEDYLSVMNKKGIIHKLRDGKKIKVKSKIDLSVISCYLLENS